MRIIPLFEKTQRGCQYCIHKQVKSVSGESRTVCPFDECPYHVLDKYKSYEEYMASEDSRILVNEYFTTIPCCYELSQLSHAPKGIFEDKGDFKMHL